ncbi:MAG: hypothetical protein AAB521_04500 [Patescibacteria group bacterium]
MGTNTPETKVQQLERTTAQELLDSLDKASKISNLTREVLSEGNVSQGDMPTIIGSLAAAENLNKAVRETLQLRGVVFSVDGITSTTTSLLEDEEIGIQDEPTVEGRREEDDDRPKTFGELLERRVDDDLLPPGQDQFKASQLKSIVGNESGMRKAASQEGMKRMRSYSREEAVRIIKRLLRNPLGNLKKREYWTKQNITSSFPNVPVAKFEETIGQVEYDWKKRPTVDHETAMEIRGLIVLMRLLEKRAVVVKEEKDAIVADLHEDEPLSVFVEQVGPPAPPGYYDGNNSDLSGERPEEISLQSVRIPQAGSIGNTDGHSEF